MAGGWTRSDEFRKVYVTISLRPSATPPKSVGVNGWTSSVLCCQSCWPPAAGNPLPQNGEDLKSGRDPFLHVTGGGQVQVPPVIIEDSGETPLDARFEDAGRYTCKAASSAGATSRVFVVVIHSPPIIVPPAERQVEAVAGRSLVLTCEAESSLTPACTWLRHDRPLSPFTNPNIQVSSEKRGEDTREERRTQEKKRGTEEDTRRRREGQRRTQEEEERDRGGHKKKKRGTEEDKRRREGQEKKRDRGGQEKKRGTEEDKRRREGQRRTREEERDRGGQEKKRGTEEDKRRREGQRRRREGQRRTREEERDRGGQEKKRGTEEDKRRREGQRRTRDQENTKEEDTNIL
ncbi:hypothetical protein Pcinc_033489 [Petrolisthes cinctipes]|uniref:Ig-like domain-containing protein n=1 Tax=Petrolisthes cinctipes TaxID=88211 RepID=A0AAE1ESB7_PETCI|nr:hypothetical protein Pcinc_033489 [Petrolisthes cinctipes]